jgi:hypothetical protein
MWKPRWKSTRLDLADVGPPACASESYLALFMKVIALIKQLLGLSASTKSQSGFLVALVVLITIGGKEAIAHIGLLKHNEAIACIALGVAGFLGWVMGQLAETKRVRRSQAQDAPAGQPAAEDPLFFFKSLKCWGVILILSAAILSYLAATRRVPVLIVRARPRTEVVITITNVVTLTNETPKVSFPPLELQGIIVNGAKSSAVINGQVLNIGERLDNVVLVAVKPEYVTVGMDGVTKWLVLRN